MWFKFLKKREEEQSQAAQPQAEMPAGEKIQETDGDIPAVIALALNLYMRDAHDYEQMVLTMQRVMRPYSPWSSKIYGLRQYPR